MKIKFLITILIASSIAIINGCLQNDDADQLINDDNVLSERIISDVNELRDEEDDAGNSRTAAYGCGNNASGSFSGTGYYTYPDRTLSFAGQSSNCVITLYVSAYEVPNKFTVRDANNNIVASSNWLGQASYPGPYGSSLNNSGSQTLTFTKGSSSTFTLQVNTMAPYPPYTLREDVWNVSISCNCPPTCTDGIKNGNETGVDCGGSCPACPSSCSDGIQNGNETGIDCGGSCPACVDCDCSVVGYNGSYNGTGYYKYPNKTINVNDIDQGCTVQLRVDALEVPNKFTLKDGNGNIVATSGWNGIASYGGPYGNSLNTPASEYITFQKGSFSSYTLEIETMAPYPPYPSRVDEWYVTKSCPN